MPNTTKNTSLHSLNSKTIHLSQKEILNLSIGNLDWESTGGSCTLSDDEDYDVLDYLHDDPDDHDPDDHDPDDHGRYDSEDHSFTGSFRWNDRTTVSDEIPELIRRRQSLDALDDLPPTEPTKTTRPTPSRTELGGRIARLSRGPTHSPRSTLGGFVQPATEPSKPTTTLFATEEARVLDDLSLDDTICTVEDAIEFLCVVLEHTTVV